MSTHLEEIVEKSANLTITFGVLGLGYVGLPLMVESAKAGFKTLGFDINAQVVERVNAGESHIADVPTSALAEQVQAGRLSATIDFGRLAECDVISICVPTPLNKIKDPDLSYVIRATESVAKSLRAGQLIFLESTTYPGTTEEIMLPVLEAHSFKVGHDFFLCYSPERVDPGNKVWHTKNTPKVLGGVTEACKEAGIAVYAQIFDSIVPVGSARAAELVKVYENTFRMINIALANELAQACEKLDVNVWDVIDAAATKPFGFMKFTPGPGLGGHCIPLDPHYLSWKMRTLAYKTRLIELAGEINSEMPAFVVNKLMVTLNNDGKAMKGSHVMLLGVAYKKDVDDLRESPAIEIISLLQNLGAEVSYHDPYCPIIEDDGHTPIKGLPLKSQPLTVASLNKVDAVVLVTDHTDVDYELVVQEAPVILDTRGALRSLKQAHVVGLS